jgi:hypothetical protein
MRCADLPVVKRHLSIALIVTSAILPLQSATLERLSLDDLIVKSTAIVRGTVSGTWAQFNGRDIQTHYTVQVSERFKGPAQASFDVITPGGIVGNLHQTVAGSPVLNKGDEFVFFLWTSKAGVTWITGLTQGLFALPGGSDSDPVATRAANRELTLDAATGRPVKENAVSLKLSDLRSRIATRLGKAGVQ